MPRQDISPLSRLGESTTPRKIAELFIRVGSGFCHATAMDFGTGRQKAPDFWEWQYVPNRGMIPPMKTTLATFCFMILLGFAIAEGQTSPQNPRSRPKPKSPPKQGNKVENNQNNRRPTINLYDMEVGQSGWLTFPQSRDTLYPLKIGDVQDGQFIGLAGDSPKVVVRGLKTQGLVSDRYYQLNGEVKVSGTEKVHGITIFVLEIVDPDKFKLQRSDMPSLVIPR